jgi:hypothetical protein
MGIARAMRMMLTFSSPAKSAFGAKADIAQTVDNVR